MTALENPEWTNAPFEICLIDKSGKKIAHYDAYRFNQTTVNAAVHAMQMGDWAAIRRLSIARTLIKP